MKVKVQTIEQYINSINVNNKPEPDYLKLLEIAIECGCYCHEVPGMMHFVPCCDASGYLIEELNKKSNE